MNIDSPRFGTLQVEAEKIIEFPQGLAGFEDCHRFSLYHREDRGHAYFILQSVDDPAVAFQLADPAHFGFSYEIELNDEESALLKLTNPQDIAVTVIVWRDQGDDTTTPLRASLKAPLLINTRERRGMQHIFHKLNCTLSNLSAPSS